MKDNTRQRTRERLGFKLVMDTFETLLHEASKLIRIFCSERVSICQSHVISVNEATLRHNCFETSLYFNDSALEGGGALASFTLQVLMLNSDLLPISDFFLAVRLHVLSHIHEFCHTI